MLFLSADDMENCISYYDVMQKVKEAYSIYKSGQFVMPERPGVKAGNRELLFMPCFTDTLMGTKVLSLFPENIPKGKPLIYAQMIVNDALTGEGLCIMNGTRLTALRTGAAGGLAISFLSRPDCKSLGIVGAGTQGLYQAIFALHSRPIEKIYIYDSFNKDFEPFIASLKAKSGKKFEVVICKDTGVLAEKSEIIVTTTNSKFPVLPDDSSLFAGKCLIGVGSYRPDMREFPASVWKVCDTVYVDLEYAMEESGDLSQPLDSGLINKKQVRLLSDVTESGPIQPAEGKCTFFKTVGMGLVDVVVADSIYRKALEKGAGIRHDV